MVMLESKKKYSLDVWRYENLYFISVSSVLHYDRLQSWMPLKQKSLYSHLLACFPSASKSNLQLFIDPLSRVENQLVSQVLL